MTTRITLAVLTATLLTGVSTSAQSPGGQAPFVGRFVDPANGLSLEQAIARAIEQEPSLRAVRSQVEVAQGTKLQASVRPNPSVSFERRQEPGGTDHLTTVGVEWPLDLFRRSERLAVADSEVTVAQLSASDRERLLAAEVRARYGDALATIRELGLLDEIVVATQNQFDLLRSRVEQGASPPLERDLVDVELRRAQADRLLQVGRTETAVFELKRVLGMKADAPLTVRDTFEALVQRESAVAPEVANASMAVEQRADVREAAARVETAVAKIDRAESEGHVDISLFGNYMRMDSGFPQRGFAPNGSLERVRGQFNYWSAGAMVTIPLLNRNQGDVAVARAEQTGATAAYDAARLAAEAEVASARARDERAREAVKIYGAGAQGLARQNLAVVGQSYELGRVTVLEVLAERRRYLDVERAYTEALRAAYEARTALNRALGEGR
ncbi:MAG: TolC family protein [Vicinamibacterales bacterium]